MKNLKVQRKLMLSFGIILVLFIISIISGLLSLENVKKQLNTFYEHPFQTQNASKSISIDLQGIQKHIYRMIAIDNSESIEDSLESINAYYEDVQVQKAILDDRFMGDANWVHNMIDALNELTIHRQHIVDMILEDRQSEAMNYMENSYMPVLNTANDYLEQIMEYANTNSEDMISQANSAQSATTVLLGALCVVSILLSIFLGIYITRAITVPVDMIVSAANQMIHGDLNVSLDYESKDEFGILTLSLKTMMQNLNAIISDIGHILSHLSHGDFHVKSECREQYVGDYEPILLSMRLIRDNLNTTLTQINEAAEQVANGSEQVSSGSQTLSQGASEQTSSIEELATTITDISEQIKRNAMNAEGATLRATQVSDEIAESSRRMKELLDAMNEIRISSTEIGKIIKAIEDIAFQTNILALNAAVEAARAGESGKGFSVVAGEVRNLANKSAKASQSTSELIRQSLYSVENGTKIANETAQSLFAVVDGVREVTEKIDNISIDTNEQAVSITQVTSGIDQISGVVQTNSATAEESAAASEELSAQAQMLNHLVSNFHLL